MRLVDTHAHLEDEAFEQDRDAVVQRATDAGVGTIITVGTSLSSSRRAVTLSDRYPQVYATVGVHPHKATSVTPNVLAELEELASHPRVVAIGEIGLDFYRDLSPRNAQRYALDEQLAMAAKTSKPIVVHIRDRQQCADAYDEALQFLRDWTAVPKGVGPANGVLHCFSGSAEMAKAALDLGFYLGVDGPITYPKATETRSVVAAAPLDRLLLETDCPYLSPQRWRGRRNEPAHLGDIARKAAELKGTSIECVTCATTENALRLFRCLGE